MWSGLMVNDIRKKNGCIEAYLNNLCMGYFNLNCVAILLADDWAERRQASAYCTQSYSRQSVKNDVKEMSGLTRVRII
jgi:hypothetical protein